MNDARRYRLNAADCMSAANTCHSDHRSLLLSIAGSWYALARQDEATRDLLASWGMAEPGCARTSTTHGNPTHVTTLQGASEGNPDLHPDRIFDARRKHCSATSRRSGLASQSHAREYLVALSNNLGAHGKRDERTQGFSLVTPQNEAAGRYG